MNSRRTPTSYFTCDNKMFSFFLFTTSFERYTVLVDILATPAALSVISYNLRYMSSSGKAITSFTRTSALL